MIKTASAALSAALLLAALPTPGAWAQMNQYPGAQYPPPPSAIGQYLPAQSPGGGYQAAPYPPEAVLGGQNRGIGQPGMGQPGMGQPGMGAARRMGQTMPPNPKRQACRQQARSQGLRGPQLRTHIQSCMQAVRAQCLQQASAQGLRGAGRGQFMRGCMGWPATGGAAVPGGLGAAPMGGPAGAYPGPQGM